MKRNMRNKFARKTAKTRYFRPQIEVLEARCVLTGFRPIDEVGNNILNPTWGTANTDLLRLSQADYADGISTPSLPNNSSARVISDLVSNQGDPNNLSQDIQTVNQTNLSDFGYLWGQFIDHDMDLTPAGSGEFDNILADPNDPSQMGTQTFERSSFDPKTGTSNPRQQVNVNTSFLDLSQVYGSTDAVADALRTHVGGQLKTSPGNLLPFNNTTYFTVQQLAALNMANDAQAVPADQLFAAGDVRANENLELTALQTLFVRNHNRLAAELQQEHPGWSDEQLYQEARKLNIATEQMITYNNYLPDLLGADALPAYTGYDPSVDPTIATEFSTVAFRFGHSLLNNSVHRQNNNGNDIADVNPNGATINLAQDFFDPYLLSPNGAVDPLTGHTSSNIGAILKGDADSNAQAMDATAINEVRNLLFADGGLMDNGQDLIARDIQRARDDGIGTYNDVRVALGLQPVTSFAQITSNVTLQNELQEAYGSVDNIDPFAGGIAEDHVAGSNLGPTFQAILVNQFTRLRDGDRFFYLNEHFTAQEKELIQQAPTLGKVIEANTNVTNLQSDVFVFKASIAGNVFLTQNGEQTRGLAGATLQLQDSSGDVLATTTTDSNGHYVFTQQSGPSANPDIASGVSATGDYNVVLILPSSLSQTTPNPGTIHISRGGIHVKGVNFGVECTSSGGDSAVASPAVASAAPASAGSGTQLAADAGLASADSSIQSATNASVANMLVRQLQSPSNTGAAVIASTSPASGTVMQTTEAGTPSDSTTVAGDAAQHSSSQADDAVTLDDPLSNPLQTSVA